MTTPRATLDAALSRLKAGPIPYRDRLAARIQALHAAFLEDYAGAAVSARSLLGLIDFLEASRPAGYPDLTMTPSGDFYAEWRGAEDRRLTIEFLDSGEVRYLLFRPNPKHPQRTDRLSGTTTADALAETMAPLAPLTGLAA